MTISFSDKDVAELQRVCRHSNIVCKSGSVWRSLALRQYGAPLLPLSTQHAEYFYKHILVRYGCLLGTWVRNDYPFGGLLDVKLQPGGRGVVGSTWRPHPDLGRPLKKTGLFQITCHEGHVTVTCTIDKHVTHTCNIQIEETVERGLLQFQTLCQNPCEHRGKSSFYINVWKRSLYES